jgi:hypothetical protein
MSDTTGVSHQHPHEREIAGGHRSIDRQRVQEFEGFLKLLLHRRVAWPAYGAQLVEDVPAGSGARKSCSFAAPLGPVGGLSPGGGTRDFWAVNELVTVNFSSAGLYPFALYCAQEIGICR